VAGNPPSADESVLHARSGSVTVSILSLDGGGIRGAFTLSSDEAISRRLR